MKVTLNLGDLDVKAKGMTFEIKDGTKKFATLEVSSSGITVNKKKVTWKKLADLLDEDQPTKKTRKRRYLGRYFAHPMMQNRRAKRDDYKPSAVRVTQRYVP
ncbi:hypothetical protein PsalMR5_04719 (plasmid) [Piscirickettsia salmonis]|uniref:hypothetical protein n=1 Tax=Piscirickettsia salmonis TaxID=1238 RepID=UPI0018ACDC4A|nr:hypothetical protein [Piscirickettsia salmonis]QGP57260.1 hypothetical protein PsalSR1_04749 [Piscirickettsia salmonis]QGP62119.1 hypothetical protein PsalBI1_04761 [Piscirickettsia salmonis]QGP66794.1 hypothetical protein PsalMR5_04719 [Piscirickettsia salmonis]